MAQVTIYVRESALEAAKIAASRSKISVSQWFAQFAEAQEQKQKQSWPEFFAEVDQLLLREPEALDGWNELLKDRYTGLGVDAPRESF